MAEYSVACGVCPPGLFQYPLAAIASTISFVVIAVPASVSTRAAAARAETFFGLAGFSLGVLALAGFASGDLVVGDFFAGMVRPREGGWLPSSGGGGHPPRRPAGVSASDPEDVLGQPRGQEVRHLRRVGVLGGDGRPAVPLEHHLPVGQAFDPKLRDPARAQ